MRVGNAFRVFRNSRYAYIDVKRPMDDLTELVTIEGDEPFILHPGEFVLAVVAERIALPADIVAALDGKSSLAGWASSCTRPQASSTPASTATSRSSWPTWPTCRSRSTRGCASPSSPSSRSTTPADHPYGSGRLGSKYQGQAEPTPSRYYLNFEPGTSREGARHRGERVHRQRGGRAARGRRARGGAVLAPTVATSPTRRRSSGPRRAPTPSSTWWRSSTAATRSSRP